MRPTPAAVAMPSTSAASSATFVPLAASRCARPLVRKSSRTSSASASSCPSTIPRPSAAEPGGRCARQRLLRAPSHTVERARDAASPAPGRLEPVDRDLRVGATTPLVLVGRTERQHPPTHADLGARRRSRPARADPAVRREAQHHALAVGQFGRSEHRPPRLALRRLEDRRRHVHLAAEERRQRRRVDRIRPRVRDEGPDRDRHHDAGTEHGSRRRPTAHPEREPRARTGHGQRRRDRRHRPPARAPPPRCTSPATSASEQEMPRMAPRVVEPRPHTVTRSRSASRRTSPIPGTSPSSSTEPKPPCCSRKARIFAAVAGPTPASVSSCSGVAVLRLTFGGRRPRRRRPRRAPGRRAGRHEHLPAVLHDGGEVHRREIGAPGRAARAAHRVVDALAAPQPIDARMLHRTGHVHGDLAALRPGGRGRGLHRQRRGRRRTGPPPRPTRGRR